MQQKVNSTGHAANEEVEIETQDKDRVDGVGALQITFVDPKTSEVRTQDVFCDVGGKGGWQSKARFLISSDLVNLLSEAAQSRHERFMQVHQKLSKSRLGYLCRLYQLRGLIVRLQQMTKHRSSFTPRPSVNSPRPSTALAEGTGKQDAERASELFIGKRASTDSKDSSKGDGKAEEQLTVRTEDEDREVCPVHFFRALRYLDTWTYEMLEKAIGLCTRSLKEEIHRLDKRIKLLGGGSWRQLLDMVLERREMTLEGLTKYVLSKVMHDDERKDIENAVTNGLRDKYNILVPKHEELSATLETYASEGAIKEVDIDRQENKIESLQRRIHELRHWLDEAGKEKKMDEEEERRSRLYTEPEKEEEEELETLTPEQVEAGTNALFEDWGARMKEAKEEVKNLLAVQKEMEGKLAEVLARPGGGSPEEEKARKDLIQKARALQIYSERLLEKEEALKEEAKVLEEFLAKKNEEIEELRRKIPKRGNGPEVNPHAVLLLKLQRKLKKLAAQEAAYRQRMLKPYNRIRAIRYQLRAMYKKLDWDWDLSESEGEDEEKPYWLRRKLASDGCAPFDPRLFVYNEKEFMRKRLQQTVRHGRQKQANEILSQLEARRRLAQEAMKTGSRERRRRMGALEPMPFDDEVRPVTGDRVERILATSSTALSAQSPPLDATQLREEPQLVPLRRDLVARMQRLQGHLQGCCQHFAESLPPPGNGDAIPGATLDTLQRLQAEMEAAPPMFNSQAEEREAAQQVLELCEVLHALVEEAIAEGELPDPADPNAGFEELWTRLERMRCAQEELAADLLGSSKQHGRSVHWSSPSTASGSGRPTPSGRQSAHIGLPNSPGGYPPELGTLGDPMPFTGAKLRGGQRSRGSQDRSDGMDLGFRPNGGTEEPLENWALLKVSRGSVLEESPERGPGRRQRADDPKNARYIKLATSGDFQEYMKQHTEDAWVSASGRRGQPPVKRQAAASKCPSLPQLVGSRSSSTLAGTTASTLNRSDGKLRRTGMSRSNASLDPQFSRWASQ